MLIDNVLIVRILIVLFVRVMLDHVKYVRHITD